MIEKAKEMISSGTASVALVAEDGTVYTDKGKSVRPLERLYRNYTDKFRNGYVADSIIGRAAASFIVAGGAKECFGFLMSEMGLEYLKANGVKASYGKLTPAILNWNETDLCPMEKTCKDIDDPIEAVKALQHFIEVTPYPPKFD